MARVTPPPIDPVPTPPIQRGDRATFSNRVDSFIRWLVNAVTQFQTVATNVYNNAVDAFQSATGAATSATSANTSATNAGNSATAAQTAREAAEDASEMAMAYALALTATSATSLVIGTGSKTFTGSGLQAKQFSVGQVLYAVNPTNSAQWMAGTVTAYTSNGASSSLTLNVTDVNPVTSGQTVANWSINISGIKGATGANGGVTGGNLTGALNERRATSDVPSAPTMDIWSGNGNYIGVTGTSTITGFTNAPQAGAKRRLLITGSSVITSGANLIIKGVSSGSSSVLTAGDELEVVAESTTRFRVTLLKADGSAVGSQIGSFMNRRYFSSSGSFVPRRTGWHRITAGGGSGRGGSATQPSGGAAAAAGGGAGGTTVGYRFLVAGQSYAMSIASAVSSGTSATGPDGGDTMFMGSGITALSALGGKGGTAITTAGTALGGAGGLGSSAAGDLILPGGKGGDATVSGNSLAATGGGASGALGLAGNGGTAVSTSGAAASGGGGVGGDGGAASSAGVRATGGGGAGGSSAGIAGGVNLEGRVFGTLISNPIANSTALFNAVGAGSAGSENGSSALAGEAGGGTGGANNVSSASNPAGALAGSGGIALGGAGSVTLGGSGGLYGGGSGGVVGTAGASTAGGTQAGYILIEY